MLRVTCDVCSEIIDTDRPGWLGVDHARVDDDGEFVQFEDHHRYHFDTADCAIAWLMERSYRQLSEADQ